MSVLILCAVLLFCVQLIYSVDLYLSSDCMPSSVLSARGTAVDNMDTSPCLLELTF